MKIIKQIIEKKLSLYEELILNRQYLRGFWQFYCCLNMAFAVLQIYDDAYKKLERKRNHIWKGWLRKEGLFDEKKFKIIQKYIRKDMQIIIKALEYINKVNEEKQFEMSQFDPPGSSYVGCLAYEFPT